MYIHTSIGVPSLRYRSQEHECNINSVLACYAGNVKTCEQIGYDNSYCCHPADLHVQEVCNCNANIEAGKSDGKCFESISMLYAEQLCTI